MKGAVLHSGASARPCGMSRWLPHPILSIVLAAVWVFLANKVDAGNIVLGAALGLAIPLFTQAFWPDRPRVQRPLKLLAFVPVFLWDVLVANLQVAWLILNFKRKLRPTWVVVPLDMRDPYAITTLANVISLTPGTISSELGPDRTTLLVHSLDVDDPKALVQLIKTRYEAPLKEAFEC